MTTTAERLSELRKARLRRVAEEPSEEPEPEPEPKPKRRYVRKAKSDD